jgi:hypothetical protein
MSVIYPEKIMYACLICGATKNIVGIGTLTGTLDCYCQYPTVINKMVEMIPKLPPKKPKDTRKRFRLARQWRQENG